MKRLILTLALLLPFALFAANDDITTSKGTNQDVIVSLIPAVAQDDVSRNTVLEAVFSVPLDPAHVKKNDIKLRCISCKKKSAIEGSVSYVEEENKVVFSPDRLLDPGMYEIEYKSLKPIKDQKDIHIEEIKYRFLVLDEVLERVELLPKTITLVEGDQHQYSVKGYYDTGVSKDLGSSVSWIERDTQVASIGNNALLTAHKAGTTTLQAKLYNIISNTADITVLIPDVVPPVVTLNGEANITINEYEEYAEQGATAHDERDGELNVTITGNVDTKTLGTYTITYTAIDKAGNKTEKTRIVTVVDITPSVITLNGEANVTIDDDSSYVELGATAVDARDGAVEITISGTVDTNILGVHTVTYSAVDKSGNKAEAKRTVHVIDITPPVITLNGEANLTITNGEAYVELGATAMDNRDGDVNVTISGSVDTTQAGTYTIIYTAVDSAGNSASKTRTVTVTIPQIVSINVEGNATSMNLGEQALLTVNGVYADGHTEEITDNIVWEITPADSAEVQGNVLTAKKDGEVSIKAKVDHLVSDAFVLDIYWEVNGHRLPPEPDPTVNNSTLQGIDSNGNGIRDDVERKIYVEQKQQVDREILMQHAKVFNFVFEDPIGNAIEAEKRFSKAGDCNRYIKFQKKHIMKLNEQDPVGYIHYLDKIILNTPDRVKTYFIYDGALSGGVYSGSLSWFLNESVCDFNISNALGDDQ
ncbi:MAG: DUF5011 domain-containing protein [Campylobacterales bacterium]|nr:DUF5011 domain-containing protein [Campylobacterales bacterium]